MKILISGAKTKFFHLEEFGQALTKVWCRIQIST